MKTEHIGTRIRHLMEQNAISIEALAERSGLEESLLQRIIRDDVYPSLGPLLKIARTLGVRLGTFIDDQFSQDPLIVRRNERAEKFSMLLEENTRVAVRFYSLGTGKTDRHMEPFFVELLPESSKEKKLSSHEGEEFIVVYSGQIEVIYGDDRHRLESGDSIYYNSTVPHYVSCLGNHVATIYAVLYTPD